MMRSKRLANRCLLLCLLVLSLAACDLVPTITVNGTPVTKSDGTPVSPSTLKVWEKVAPGVELRTEVWTTPAGDSDTATIVRFDLKHIKLSIGYQPTQPLLLSEWMQKENATAIMNGGYFDQQNNATALVVSAGQAAGTSYDGFGGMLAVDSQGHISLRSLHAQPYDPNNEQLQQATQCAPMLVLAGGKRSQFHADASSSRRSVVAMDKQGRLLLIALPGLAYSLDELADQLVASDLNIDEALNLDGGSSTGLYVRAGNQHVAIDSLARLPIVIIVKAS